MFLIQHQRTPPWDFSFQPIDISDAIAKAHDVAYDQEASVNYEGYLEDVRTLQADNDMLANIDAVLNGASASDLGLETPFNTGMSSETKESLNHQKKFIGAIASYKSWKSSQANNGEGISFSNRADRKAYIQAGETRKERWQRRANVALLQLAGN